MAYSATVFSTCTTLGSLSGIRLQNLHHPQRTPAPTGSRGPSSPPPAGCRPRTCLLWTPRPNGTLSIYFLHRTYRARPAALCRLGAPAPQAQPAAGEGAPQQAGPDQRRTDKALFAPEVLARPLTRKRSAAATASAEGFAARARRSGDAGPRAPWSSSPRSSGCGAASLTATGGSRRCCSMRG